MSRRIGIRTIQNPGGRLPEEKILDGDFELGDLSLYWNPSSAWYGWAVIETSIVYRGKYSAKLVGNNPNNWNLAVIYQVFSSPILVSSIKSFTCRFKNTIDDSNAIDKLNIYLTYSDATAEDFRVSGSTTIWTQANILSHLNTVKSITDINFIISDVQITYIDDVSLKLK